MWSVLFLIQQNIKDVCYSCNINIRSLRLWLVFLFFLSANIKTAIGWGQLPRSGASVSVARISFSLDLRLSVCPSSTPSSHILSCVTASMGTYIIPLRARGDQLQLLSQIWFLEQKISGLTTEGRVPKTCDLRILLQGPGVWVSSWRPTFLKIFLTLLGLT